MVVGTLNRGCEQQCEQGAPKECEQKQGENKVLYVLFALVLSFTNKNKIKAKIGD